MSNKKQQIPDIRFKGFTDDWEQRTLITLMDFSNGINAPKENYGKGRKMISVMDILSKEPISYDNIRNSVEVDSKTESNNKVENGDIVFVRSSEVRNEVGWAKAYLENEFALYSGFTIRGKKIFDFDAFFVELSINGKNREQIESKAGGSTRFNVSQSILKSVVISEPSLVEQKKISAFFKQLDDTIALHQRQLYYYKELKKATLQKMFPREGETIPEVRFEGFTEEWEQRTLGELMDISSASRVHKNEWTKSGVRFFRSSDVVASYNKKKNTEAFISHELYEELSSKSGKVSQGDILITGGGSIGIPYLIKDEEPLYFKDADLIWLKNSEKLNGYFLFTYFITNGFRQYLGSISHIGTISHYTIEQAKVTPISLPNEKEQDQLGSFFEQLDNAIALHQQKIINYQTAKSALFKKMFV